MFAELLAEPGVEEQVELRAPFGFMALHGGGLERGTAEIASASAEAAGASLYAVVQPEGLDWHIPSPQIDPDASEGLRTFLEHVDVVVSVHGYGREERLHALLIGGAHRDLAIVAAGALRDALPAYRVIDDLEAMPVRMRGVHPRNPVNRTRGGGVQLELPPRIRDEPSDDREILVATLVTLATSSER